MGAVFYLKKDRGLLWGPCSVQAIMGPFSDPVGAELIPVPGEEDWEPTWAEFISFIRNRQRPKRYFGKNLEFFENI